MKTFAQWLRATHLGKDTPIGDLAFDVTRDKTFPKENDREVIQNHLARKGACKECLTAFRRAWQQYSREVQ